jgi:lysyl-tRNA synthetase class 2
MENTNQSGIIDDPIEVRKAKRRAIIDGGGLAYAYRFQRSATSAELQERYKDLADGQDSPDTADVAGRVMSIRGQGKLQFMTLRDASGELQVFCSKAAVEPESWDLVKSLDVGDFIGVHGQVVRTKRGELSVAPGQVELLTKSIRPLPEKFHGLSDKETRYRQRYVDLVMNPEVRKTFEARSRIVSAIRRAAEDEHFMEVETPMLHPIPGGANAKPFVTHHNALDTDFYLRVAPELNLKRLLVGGFERVFELNRCFRNEGMDHYHNPEFTTFEAYQAYTDLFGIAAFTRRIIQAACLSCHDSLQITYQGQAVDLSGEWPFKGMPELVSEAVGEEVSFGRSLEELQELCKRYHIDIKAQYGKGRLINELYEELVEGSIVQPTFVYRHPLEVSPLAKKTLDDPELVDRCELVICGHEYSNSFSELNDPVDQEQRFVSQQEAKAYGDQEAMGYDADYVRALEYGMPPAGGTGIGIDRLVMLLTDSESIRDVLLFPHMRAES